MLQERVDCNLDEFKLGNQTGACRESYVTRSLICWT